MLTRRDCLKMGAAAGLLLLTSASVARKQEEISKKMKLGIVTYNIAKDWDIPTIIERCRAVGIEGVELRTTHAHGVEPPLSQTARQLVRKNFEDSGITLWGLGTTCEFHSDDPALVLANVETCKAFILLARDVGAKGVKVRPNGLQLGRGIPEEQTIEQIANALRECAVFAANYDIEVWLEVHGHGTDHPPRIKSILQQCAHPSAGVCWNSNPGDIKNGSVREYFKLLRPYIKSCHIHELWRPDYPWRELLTLLAKSGYNRFTLAEIPESSDPECVLRYYRALWMELTRLD